MVTVFNEYGQLTSKIETEVTYPRCFKESVLRNYGQRL